MEWCATCIFRMPSQLTAACCKPVPLVKRSCPNVSLQDALHANSFPDCHPPPRHRQAIRPNSYSATGPLVGRRACSNIT